MASLDVQRPAAQEQLAQLGRQIGVTTLPIVPGQRPVEITRRALEVGRREGYDVVMLDTAGRLHVNEELMLEVAAVREAATPHQTLLVADAMTGQDAVNVAKAFGERAGITGIVLTRVDGDARGGAALSMRAITGKPIVLIGTGEKIDALEPFHPDRIAGRILGMGDVVSLVETRLRDRRPGRGREARPQDAEGRVRPRRSRRAVPPDPPHGRDDRHARHAARDRQDQEADGRRQYRRDDHQAPGGDHRLDDQARAAQPEAA